MHDVHYLALSLNTSARYATIAQSRSSLPELQIFKAVNGFDKRGTIAALCRSRLHFHYNSFCSFPRFGTYGSLANYLTKFLALVHQVTHRYPFMAMLEDDMVLSPGFRPFVEELVQARFLNASSSSSSGSGSGGSRPDVLVLGAWGEGYVTSLASARRAVDSLLRQGIPLTVDIMINDGHVGRVERVRGTPWRHSVGPNLGDCLKTEHIQRGDLPRPCLAEAPKGCHRQGTCIQWYRAQTKTYCRGRRRRNALPPGPNGAAA